MKGGGKRKDGGRTEGLRKKYEGWEERKAGVRKDEKKGGRVV